MASKNYRYLKDGSKNPNYKPATTKKTSSASNSNKPVKANKTSTASKTYRYDKQGKMKTTSPVPAVDRNPQEEKEKQQLPKLVAWGNAVKDFLAGGKDEKEKEPVKEQQKGNDFDAQFTEDFFENNDRARYLVGKGVDGTTAQEKAEFVIMDRMLQAGVTNSAKVGGDDNRYKTSDEVYDVNNTVNQGANQIWMDAFYKQATEDDIRAVIGNWQQMIDLAPEGSDFRRRVQEDLDSLKGYAKNNFSSFANEEMRMLGEEIQKTRDSIAQKSMAYDANLLAAANDALEAGRSGYNLYDYVNNRSDLREAVGFDELEAQYEDPDDFTDALRAKLETISGAETAVQDKNNTDVLAQHDRLAELQGQLDAAGANYADLLTAEKYQKMLGESWVPSAAAQFNPEDYQWYTRDGERTQYNLPSLAQIIENPEAVKGQYEQARAAGAGSGMAQTIDLVGRMTDEEKALYKAIYAEQGEEAADAYFRHKEAELYDRQNTAYVEEKTAFAEENPLWASVASVPEKLLGTLGMTADMLAGREGQNQFAEGSQAERAEVERQISEATPWAVVNGTNLMGSAYQGFMSFMDSLFNRAVTGLAGGGNIAGDVLLGLGSAADAYSSAYEATDGDVGKAIVVGLASGALEAGTEHISWGKLSDAGNLDSATNVLKYILAAGTTEGGEEVISGLGSKMIEGLVMGGDSEIAQKYKDYTANGYKPIEAIGRMAKEIGWETTLEFFIGSLMGGGAASVNAAVQVGQQASADRSLGRQIQDKGNAAAVIRAALASADEKIRALGNRLASKIQEGGLPQDSETAAELQVVAEAEGLDANGQKTTPSAQEQVPPFEIKQPDNAAVPVQQPAEEAAPVAEEEPVAPVTEETGSISEAEETPELEWNEPKTEQAAPAAEKVSPEEAKKAVTEVFKGSTRKLGKLYRKMMGALDVEISTKSVAEIKTAVQNRLKQLGEDVIDPVATAIAKLASGEQMTSDELDLLEASTVRQGVLNEVATSLIRNGGREYLSDETVNLMERRSALQQATTAKNVTVAQKQTAAAPARVQEMVEETIAADEDGSIQARAQMLGNEEAAQTMIKMAEGVTNTRAYATAFEAAYDYGTAGIDQKVASTSKETTALTPEQFQAAYQAGVKAAAAPVRAAKTGGKVTFAGDLGSRLNEMDGNQREGINALRKIASIGTVNIEFFQSEANAEGKYTAENGSYDPKTNTIRIDVNAGRNNVRSANNFALLRVASHELTHYIKAQNTEGYKALQDFVVKQLPGMGDKSFDALVAEKMVQQPELSYSEAVEEVVANGCEMMLKDSTAIQRLAQENKGLFRRIRNWLRNFIASVKRAFRGVEAYSTEATLIKDLEGLQKLWDNALVQAGRNVQQSAAGDIGITTNEGGDTAYVENPGVLYSLRSYNESDYVKERDKAAAALAKKMGVTEEQAGAYIDDVTSIAAIVAADRDRLDFEAEEEYSAMKHNSEYKYTMDFSTLCKKRLLYTGTFDAIQKQLGDTALTEDDYIQLRQMMADRGYEVACAFCYVESRRKNNGEIINKFLDTYKAAQKDGKEMELGPSNRRKAFATEKGFTPKISDFNTSEGIANIMHNHRGVYDAYMYFMNARGVSKPKLIESRTDYRNEILKKFRSPSAVRAMNRRGGLRLQSFSDFEVVNMLDMMQVVMDMSRVGLMSQAYTKVPDFARVFGGTGVKINLSLVTKGVDKNGKLIFDDIEGMPHKEAFKIRDMYSDHVGTILVGKDDATIRAAMADPRIDFIIPYHASGWSTENQNALGIGSYTNFTAGQNETSAATGKTVKNFQPSEYWDYSKSGDENAQAYLEKCRETGRIPKFPQYQNFPGYWKMLIDFKMYNNEGVGSPQRAVRPDFNQDAARDIMKNYAGGHQNLPVARDVVDDFVKQYKQKDSGVRYSNRMDEEYQNAYDDYDDARAREIIQEAAIAAGYSPLKLYHGTKAFGFTKIDPSMADDGISFFTSTDEKVSQTYVGSDARIRRLGSKDGITVDQLTNADGRTLLPLLHKYFDEAYELVGQDEVLELVGDEGVLIRKRIIPKVEVLRKAVRERFEEWPLDVEKENAILKAYDGIVDVLNQLSHAKNYIQVDDLFDAYHDALTDLRGLADSESSIVNYTIGEDLRQRVSKMREYLDGDMFKVEDEWSAEYINTNQAINMLAPKVLNGIYELYGKTDNLLEIDGKGANWNRLDGGFLLGKTYATTRDFAEYAKEMGFDGVHFKNIHDVGGLANYNAASDIYTFFNPSDVKSADPFTFDDDGNLIPPSKRFDSSRSDIRYSKREGVEFAEDKYYDRLISRISELNDGSYIKVGQIMEGGVLNQVGLPISGLYFDVSKIKRQLEGHNDHITDRELRLIPEILRNPIVIVEAKKENTVSVYGELMAGKSPVMVGIVITKDRSGRNLINKVRTIHARRDFADQINDSSVLYLNENKKRTRDWFQARGIDVPLGGNNFGFIRSITYTDPDVKKSIRTDSLTDREILADAFENVAQNDTERSFLKNYRDKIADLQKKQEQLRTINKDITDRKAKAERKPNGRIVYDEELIKQQNRAKILRAQIDREDNAIIEMIKSKPLQDVLRRQKQRIEKQEAGKRREAIATIRDRKNATEVRHKIKAVLDDFNRRLKNPTEKSYIPANMVQLVIAAEELIDTRSGREGEKAQAKLAALQGMYERYKSDATFAYVYDPVIADMLGSLSNVVGNKSIYQLNSAELQSVYETLKALKKQVTEAVQLKAGNYARSIIEAGREMIRETQAAAPLAKGKAGEFLNWQLTPDKFFARLAGFKKNSIWSKVAESFSKGTEKMLEIQRDHYYHFKRFTESKEFDKLNDQKHLVDIGLTNDKGETVKVTRGMMLSAYMHLSNEENARGFMYGGFSIPNLKAYYDGKVKESYGRGSANTRGTAQELYELAQQMNDPNLTEEQLAALEAKHDQLIMEGMNRLEQMRNDIYSQMTQYEKDLVAAVRAWNDGKSQAYINDVTMDLYGIKKASVQNYFPIHRDTAFVNTDFASISRNVNLENWGSLKTRVPSQAPILLTDIAYEMDSSLNQMSRYVGYARAQRDFGKLYNVRMPGMSGSVKKAVSVKFGTGSGLMGVSGEQYIENYIGSITGSRQGQSGPLSLIRRNLVRSTMTLNLRVGFSQLSAIPKAAAEVGWDSMISGFAKGGFKAIFSKNAREDLAKQNAWFWQRYRGEGGQREFADAKGGNDIISKAWNKMDDITRGKLLNWCQNFDVMSTVSMWSMAKAWARKHTNYAEGSAEFIEAANKKYTDILRNTQAMSTTSEQSDAARTPGDVLNMFTMFKSEAFANFNLLYDAVAKLRKYSADFKAGKNDVTKADVNAAKRHLAGAATSVIIGASLGNALLKLLINALTHSMDNYRDDEDEITLESTLASIGKEVASDTAGMVMLGGELYELFSAWVLKEKYYAPNDMALAELTEAFETLTKYFQDEDQTLDDLLNTSKKLAFNVTNMLGVPAENMKRYWKGAAAWLDEAQSGTLGSWEGGVTRTNSTNYDRLYNAAIAGDDAKFDRVLAELVENGVEEKDARSKFVSGRVKDAYKDGSLTEDEAFDLLVSYGGKDNDEAFWTMDEWSYEGEGNYSQYADLRTALENANASAAQTEIQKLTGHGVKEDSVIKEITKAYNNGTATNIVSLQIRSDRLFTNQAKPKGAKKEDKADPNAFDAFIEAVLSGRGLSAEIARLEAQGYITKNFMTALNQAFGSDDGRYRKMEYYNPSDARILLDRILDAYEAIGKDRNEEIAWINENWEKFVPDTDE